MSESGKIVLVHVSDLHFGDLSFDGPMPEPVVKDWWQLAPWFDGWLGHDYRAMLQLDQLVRDIRAKHGDSTVHIVATGDLTANGSEAQASNALQFLRDRLSIDGVPVGLRGDAKTLVISGNHDNWPASNRIVGPRPTWLDQLGQMPDLVLRAPITDRFELIVVRIDSDAESNDLERILVRGSFVKQCETLESQIGPRNDHEIRVLLVHHSYLERGITLSMNAASRKALRKLIRCCGITRVLTGHAHRVNISQLSDDCPELRCGTSTQLADFPSHWHVAKLQHLLGVRNLHRNAVLVHVIEGFKRKLSWSTETWVRPRASGYGPGRSNASPFELVHSDTQKLRI